MGKLRRSVLKPRSSLWLPGYISQDAACLGSASRQICTAARRIELQPFPFSGPTPVFAQPLANVEPTMDELLAKLPGGCSQLCLDNEQLSMLPISLDMIIEAADASDVLECSSVLKKRRKAMNKHRHRKRLKANRNLKKKLGKI